MQAKANHADRQLSTRAAWAVASLACLAPLVVAAFLTPSPDGHGTHCQVGLPPCGWVLAFGAPCATCGMTTAFAYAVRLEFIHAFKAQPFGLFLSLMSAIGFWVGLHAALTGSRLAPMLARALLRPRALWALFALGAAAWAYKWLTWTG